MFIERFFFQIDLKIFNQINKLRAFCFGFLKNFMFFNENVLNDNLLKIDFHFLLKISRHFKSTMRNKLKSTYIMNQNLFYQDH